MTETKTFNLTELYDVRIVGTSMRVYGRRSGGARYVVVIPLDAQWVRFFAEALGQRVAQMAEDMRRMRMALVDAAQRG